MKTEESTTPGNVEERPRSEQKVGAFLRARREARGLTLDAVAASTRIKKGYLEAIEADDYGALPSGPFVSGFIASYARVLGVEQDEIEPMIPEIEPPPIVDPAVRQDPDWKGPPLEIRELPVGGRGGTLTAWGIAIAVTLVLVLIVVWFSPSLQGWLGLDLDLGGGTMGSAEPAPVSSRTPAPEAQAVPGPASVDGNAAKQALSQKTKPPETPPKVAVDAGGGHASNREGETGAGLKKLGIRRLAPIVGADDQSYLVYTDDTLAPGEPQEVEVVARFKSYLRVSTTLDGEPAFDGILKPGDNRKHFTSQDDLWLVVGNGGGVDVYYNGNRLPPIGKFGERSGVAFRVRPGE